jgi:hypothetical protein
MKTGDEFSFREHRTAPLRRFRVDVVHADGSFSADNVVSEAANRKGGYVPRTYLTPTNIACYEAQGSIEWHTEAV